MLRLQQRLRLRLQLRVSSCLTCARPRGSEPLRQAHRSIFGAGWLRLRMCGKKGAGKWRRARGAARGWHQDGVDKGGAILVRLHLGETQRGRGTRGITNFLVSPVLRPPRGDQLPRAAERRRRAAARRKASLDEGGEASADHGLREHLVGQRPQVAQFVQRAQQRGPGGADVVEDELQTINLPNHLRRGLPN